MTFMTEPDERGIEITAPIAAKLGVVGERRCRSIPWWCDRAGDLGVALERLGHEPSASQPLVGHFEKFFCTSDSTARSPLG